MKKESGLSLKEIGKTMGVSLGVVQHHWAIAKRRMAQDKEFARRTLKYILLAPLFA